MPKYLITGGAGFIGSHLAESLIAAGHQVVVLDNLSSGKKENLASVLNRLEFIEGDIRDTDACRRAADGCTGIFHEAAMVSVPASVEDPRANHDINITGTFNILESAREKGVTRITAASSAAVYGDNPELPKHEDMPPAPKSPYATAKAVNEYYLRLYAECYGLTTVALRYFNVFGPRQDPSSPYSGVISIFSKQISNGEAVTIFGDGCQTRDFVNVADVVRANIAAMDKTEQELAGGFSVFNIAAGQQTSLLTLLSLLEKIQEQKVDRSFKAARSGDIRHSGADIARARQSLGYAPQITLEKGLRELLSTNY